MKKNLPPFVAGMLTMALISGLGVTALAASGAVTFNASNLSLNGAQISAKGENYTLANGQSVPASITYTDEKGGGTTYLPVRRIAELMGVETGWDGATGSVTVKGEVKAPAEPTTPPNTTASTDYSDWSKEDEAAYQEFKAMWEVSNTNSLGVQTKLSTVRYATTNLSSENTKQSLISFGEENVKMFVKRMTEEQYKTVLPSRDELSKYENMFVLWFWTGEVQFSGLCEVNADYIKATETYSELNLPSKK